MSFDSNVAVSPVRTVRAVIAAPGGFHATPSRSEMADQSAELTSSSIDLPDASGSGESVRLSYKFQRLREKLREAIASGELSGRLPGERQLARRFRVNAKTLSKALTDLAAEGLLDRSIGRGTFVRGTETPATQAAVKWLIICDADQVNWKSVELIKTANPDAHVSVGVPDQRPSFLNPFKAAVIFARQLPDAFIRDLVVRNIAVVAVGREPNTFSTHAVLADLTHGANCIARDLLLAGHRRLLAVEERGSSQVAHAIRMAAARYAPDATVETVYLGDVEAAMSHGATAIVCDSFRTAGQVGKMLERMELNVPGAVSLAAVGFGGDEQKVTGYVVSADAEANSVLELLRNSSTKRPTTLWLAAKSVDAGTTAPAASVMGSNRTHPHHDLNPL